jgi:hypothetical protein
MNLSERHLLLLKKGIRIALIFSIIVFLLSIAGGIIDRLMRNETFRGSFLGVLFYLSFYCFLYCVLTSAALLLALLVYGRVRRIPMRYFIKTEIILCIAAIVIPIAAYLFVFIILLIKKNLG